MNTPYPTVRAVVGRKQPALDSSVSNRRYKPPPSACSACSELLASVPGFMTLDLPKSLQVARGSAGSPMPLASALAYSCAWSTAGGVTETSRRASRALEPFQARSPGVLESAQAHVL